MKFNESEKIILTLLDEIRVKGSIELIQKHVTLKKDKIVLIIDNLIENKFIEIIASPQEIGISILKRPQ